MPLHPQGRAIGPGQAAISVWELGIMAGARVKQRQGFVLHFLVVRNKLTKPDQDNFQST